MKTSLYSTLSSLAVLTATAIFLSTACPALGAASGSPNNPDKVCKYKKKCTDCGENCDQDSDPENDTKTKTVGHNEECPDPVTAGFGEDYEFAGEETATRSARTATSPVIIRSGFSADFINPKNLNVYGQGAEIVRDANANVRQIKTDTGFLDVVFTPETKTVELRQYKPEDIGKNKVNGIYPINEEKVPIVILRYVQEADDIIRVDTIDNSNEFPSVKSERTKQTVGPGPYTLTQQKTYMKGEGLSAVEYRRVSKTITGIPNGQPKEEQYLFTVEDLGTDGQWYITERRTGRRAEYKSEEGLVTLYECNAVNENGTPMSPIATETSYTYYTDPLKPESFGKVRTLRRNNGYWENKYYDENANAGIKIEKTESPWLNTTAHEPDNMPQGKVRVRMEVACSTDSGLESFTETVDDIVIKKEWTEKSPVNQQMVKEVRHQPHSGGDKVTTTVRYRIAKDIPSHLSGKPVSIHNADGSIRLYSYVLNGQDLTVTIDSGYGDENTVTHGTRMISTQDKDSGNLKEEVRYALEGGQPYWLGSKTGVIFDNKGVALKWVYDNNHEDYTEQRKDCCHITWEKNRDGVVTTYTYDAAGRKTSTTTRGITKTIEYNGLTTIRWKQATGSTQKYLEEENRKNLAQKVTEQKKLVVSNKILKTQKSYNISNRNTITTTPYGTKIIHFSTADGQTLSETGTTGITQTYIYTPTVLNGGGLVITLTDGNKNQTIVSDMLSHVVTKKTAHNFTTQYAYDAAGRLTKTVLPDGETQLYSYEDDTRISGVDLNGDGTLTTTVDRIQKTKKEYDPTWPEGKGSWKNSVFIAWQGNWQPVSISWETEDSTLMRNQIPGILGYAVKQKSPITQYGINHTESVTTPDGMIHETAYDMEDGHVTAITVTLKNSTGQIVNSENSTLDIWGNIKTQTTPRTGTTHYVYEEGTKNHLSTIMPDQTTLSYQYDDYGRPIVMVFPDSSKQHIAYDNESRIVRQWGSQQYPVYFEYNAYGQKTSMTTYRIPVSDTAFWPEGLEGDKTTWSYDSTTSHLLKKTYADGKGVTYTYTLGGKLKTQTNARGGIITYSYNSAGELTSTQFNDNGLTPAKTYTYDQLGRMISASTEGVADYQYSYNNQNKIIEEHITIPTINGNLKRDLVRFYDTYGRPKGYQLIQGDVIEQNISYEYTLAGQIEKITADGKAFDYTYLSNDPQLISQITSPVHIVTNTYEANRDILSSKINRWKNKFDTPIISGYKYNVNSLGQRISVTTEGEAFGSNPANWIWEYDALGQIVSANKNIYAYDQIGNRRTSRKGNNPEIVYTTNTLNQYSQIGNATPSYDTDGNQLTGLTPTETLPNRNTLAFVYNTENRPINVFQNGESCETYSYDHMGRRIKKGEIITLYDGYNAIAEYKDTTRILKTTYAWGNDLLGVMQEAGGVGGLLSITEYGKQLPFISYPCYDGNGNISEYLTEEGTGTLVAHYEYDSFGNITNNIGNREYVYQFSTKPYDTLTGLNYYNYRNYDPISGRWLFRDLSEENGGASLIAFINNDPISKFDYLGLCERKAKASFELSEYVTIYPGIFFGGGGSISVEKDTCDCCLYANLKLEAEFGLGIKVQKKLKGKVAGYGFEAAFGFEASYAKTKAINDDITIKYCPETGETSGGGDISLLHLQLGGEVGVTGSASISAPYVSGALSASGTGKLAGYASIGAMVEFSGDTPKVELYGQAGVNIMYSVSVSGQLFVGPVQIGEHTLWESSGSAFDKPIDTGKVTITTL